MYRLKNETRNYAWGSREFIPHLLGEQPGDRPQAELWLGAHPMGSSRIVELDASLKDQIAADPERHLGPLVNAEYPERLPFLLKVLAAAQPLSLQAHPSPAHAKVGFAAEEERGVPLDDPKRSYKDPFAKPELFVALTTCEVLCGFRPAAEAADLLGRLGISALSPYIASLLTGRAADGLRVVVTTLLSMPEAAKIDMATRVVEECRRVIDGGDAGPSVEAYRWAVRLGEAYPGDVGVVLSLLLNLITLEPGQAIFVGGGKMHTYLHGSGIEAQANSDNTLRGGLTPKHVDVAELLRIIDFEPALDQVIEPVPVEEHSTHCAGARTWPTPAREFALFDWEIAGTPRLLKSAGPSIVLCLDGAVHLTNHGDDLELVKGESAYIAASEPHVTATGKGRLMHITVGQVPRSK
ncbi:mannose-6-phosphate isomerase, class I [Cumulibacter manganitolerans]|uniref:mannose-6-phosphate isomerase, class I n=1 Tax=Cumulibacter manganitolerans TaxID=1884992 RepID=UPI001E3EEDD6|nr:mannose-6-phosphate isomerase, class I [Cumulibacter manganitolerans]